MRKKNLDVVRRDGEAMPQIVYTAMEQWAMDDQDIGQPAVVECEFVSRIVYNATGEREQRRLLYVVQGDESVYIDMLGRQWDYDDFGLEIRPVKETIDG
jgi:hypothetical protein